MLLASLSVADGVKDSLVNPNFTISGFYIKIVSRSFMFCVLVCISVYSKRYLIRLREGLALL